MNIQEFKKKRRSPFPNGSILLLLLVPGIAFAYVGPGAGLSAIGTVLALIGAVLLGLVGVIWYPVKRLLGGRKKEQVEENAAPEDLSAEVTSTMQQTDSKQQDV